jgi:predicted ArsR family transcriptional regulator
LDIQGDKMDTETLQIPEPRADTSDELREQLDALKEPIRFKLWRSLYKPRTMTDVAKQLGLDRKLLYYHLKVLINTGLVEEKESHQVRGCVEKTYKKIEVHLKDKKGNKAVKREIRQLILDSIDEMREESEKSLTRDGIVQSQMINSYIRVKSENLPAVTKVARELAGEYDQRIRELDDEEGDLVYRSTVVQYEIAPADVD